VNIKQYTHENSAVLIHYETPPYEMPHVVVRVHCHSSQLPAAMQKLSSLLQFTKEQVNESI
jgi:hypothetical protein